MFFLFRLDIATSKPNHTSSSFFNRNKQLMNNKKKKRHGQRKWLGKHKRRSPRKTTIIQREERTKIEKRLQTSIDNLQIETIRSILLSNPKQFTNHFLGKCYASLWTCGIGELWKGCHKTDSKLPIAKLLIEMGGLDCDKSDHFYQNFNGYFDSNKYYLLVKRSRE